MSDDYYAILGLPDNATERQVRERFRELAREQHPDRFQGAEKERAETEFQRITQAFNVLGDAERRRKYDLARRRPEPAEDDTSAAARVYMRRGIQAYKQKRYPEAADNFERATGEDESDAQAWYYLALACSHRTAWHRRACEAVETAIKLEPMNATYLKFAGRLFAEIDLKERAERYFQQALDWGGQDAEIEAALETLRGAGRKGGIFGRTR